MIILGDIHYQENRIKKLQVEKFFDWLNNQSFIKKEKVIIFLGDLFEIPTPSSTLVSYYLNLFLNIWKDKKIYILQGNHDYNLSTNSLDFFESLNNVEIIKELSIKTIENKTCLFLPYYSYEGTNEKPMWEYYSSLFGEYDYIFGHIEDETQHFGDKYCDLKNVKGKRIFGHIHTPDIQKDGHYLGSCIKNSSTERSDQKYLAIIKENFELKEIPSFLDYKTIKYGDSLNTKELTLLSVNEAPSKIDVINQYENSNIKINKVVTKRQALLEKNKVVKISEEDSWRLFCKEKDLNKNVKRIVEKLL